ncbi:MAG: hypothetical protein FJW37_07210, partial [Acidobacteria bacterium]|nr:hypothetical protein [Acidobacteriota bacterium]
KFMGAASGAVLGAPALLEGAKSYRYSELESRIARRDFRGISKQDLPTPVLVLDQEIFERNLRHMAGHCKATGIHLRAHVKVHRSADIGQRQVKAGAIGLSCATIAECELMSASGISGLLWTAQPVGINKTQRVAALAKKDPTFMCVADDPIVVDALNEAAAAANAKVRVVVDIDVGIGRQGTQPGREALDLAERVMKSKSLALAGLMGYSGRASHTSGWEERRRVSREEAGKLLESVSLCRASGVPVEIVTGGSTGTYNIDSDQGWLTELQAGSYALMDSRYAVIGSKSGSPTYDDFGCALTVLTRVISKKYPNKAAIDAGNKSMTQPSDVAKGWPGVRVERAGAEYGMLLWDQAEREPKLGDLVELIPSNLDMSVNTFDRMYVCQGDQVVDVFSVLGRTGPPQK